MEGPDRDESRIADVSSDKKRFDVQSEVVSCPECEHPTGVPVPVNGSVVESAEEADGREPTVCLNCENRFHVFFSAEPTD